jgi:hypothetical protein
MEKVFADFVREFQEALKRGDLDFITAVYQDWVDTSGMLPPQFRDNFAELVLEQVRPLAESVVASVETFDDFGIVHFDDPSDPDSETSMMFRLKNDGWVMFDGRSNFIHFTKVYTISYNIQGGRIALRINGKRHPLISEQADDQVSAVVSPINCTLNVGENTMDVIPVDGEPQVDLRISSATEGDIADSSESDVLFWQGTVTAPVELPLTARNDLVRG